jgi:hypothetical protein
LPEVNAGGIVMAQNEPDVNNPRCQPGVDDSTQYISSERAEYREKQIELIIFLIV